MLERNKQGEEWIYRERETDFREANQSLRRDPEEH